MRAVVNGIALVVVCAVALGCGNKFNPPDADDDGVDAADTGAEGDVATDPGECVTDGDCDDGEDCNGSERCDDGTCMPGVAAVDGTDCTWPDSTPGICIDEACIPIPPHCGDGNVDYAEGEECDDGNTVADDGCDRLCRREVPPHCGDGHLDLDEGEQCDDGGVIPGDGCSHACQYEPVGWSCGDTTMDPWEVCDDGNTDNGDGCNPTCNLTNTTELFVGRVGTQGLQDGTGTSAYLGGYGSLTIDADYLYYGDGPNFCIRRIEIASRTVQTIAGDAVGGTSGYLDDAVGLSARFDGVEAVATDGVTLWVAGGRRIRSVNMSPPFAVATAAGSGAAGHADGVGNLVEFEDIRGLTYHGGYVYLLDSVSVVLRRYDPMTDEVVTLAGGPYVTGDNDGFGSAARFQSPRYMTSDNSGMLYISDTLGGKIRAYSTVTTYVSTFAGNGSTGYGDGTGTSAFIHHARGITSDGTSVYWCEVSQHTLRQGILATQEVSTLAGQHCGGASSCLGGYMEGVGTAAQLDGPYNVVFHLPTNSLYFIDSLNYVIRRVY